MARRGHDVSCPCRNLRPGQRELVGEGLGAAERTWVRWTDLVTDLKIRHYVGMRAVRAGRAMAKMGEAVEDRVTDPKIHHYAGLWADGWGARGERRRLWFGARRGCGRR